MPPTILEPIAEAPVESLSEDYLLKETWEIVLPDWYSLDTVLKSQDPFVLWPIGDQCLLYHWLDYAVNNNCKKITFYASDRPAHVRKALEEAHLWPIEWELKSLSKIDSQSCDAIANHLPSFSEEPLPTDGWQLLDYWFLLQKKWLDTVLKGDDKTLISLSIGRFCSIHPSVEINMPVWIGDYVSIGPGSVIGPYACINNGCIVEGPSEIRNSFLGEHTFLSGHTELTDAYLEGGRFISLRHRSHIENMDAIIAGDLNLVDAQKPSILERFLGLGLFVFFSLKSIFAPSSSKKTWTTFQGVELSEHTDGPLWYRRLNWFWHVFCGDLKLIGVLPRTETHLSETMDEWADILKSATAGVISYSDLEKVHSIEDEIEPVHAVYQATHDPKMMQKMILASYWKLLHTEPIDE